MCRRKRTGQWKECLATIEGRNGEEVGGGVWRGQGKRAGDDEDIR